MVLVTVLVIPPRTKGRSLQDEVAAIPDDNKFKVTCKTTDTISTVFDQTCKLWYDDLGMEEDARLSPFCKVTGLDGAKFPRDTPMIEVFPSGTPLADQVLCFQQEWAAKLKKRLAKTSRFKFSSDRKRGPDELVENDRREIKRRKKHLNQGMHGNAEVLVPNSEVPARHLAIPTPRRSSQPQIVGVPSTNASMLPASQMPPLSSQVNPSRLPPPTANGSCAVEVQLRSSAAQHPLATQSTVNSGVLDAAYGPASQSVIGLTQDDATGKPHVPAVTVSVPPQALQSTRPIPGNMTPAVPTTNAFDIMRSSQPAATHASQPRARRAASSKPKAASGKYTVDAATLRTAKMRAQQRKKKTKGGLVLQQPSEDWTDGETMLLAKFMRDKKWTSAKCAAALGTGRSHSSVRNRKAWLKTNHPEWLLSSPRASQVLGGTQATLFGNSAGQNAATGSPSRKPPPAGRLPRLDDLEQKTVAAHEPYLDYIHDCADEAKRPERYVAKDLLVHHPLSKVAQAYNNPPDMWDTEEARQIDAVLNTNSQKKRSPRSTRGAAAARFRRPTTHAAETGISTIPRFRTVTAVVVSPCEVASEGAIEVIDSNSPQAAMSGDDQVKYDAGVVSSEANGGLPWPTKAADEEIDEVITTFLAQKASSRLGRPNEHEPDEKISRREEGRNATKGLPQTATATVDEAVSRHHQLAAPSQAPQSTFLAQITRVAAPDSVKNGTMTLEEICEEVDQLEAFAEYMSDMMTLSELYDCIKKAFRNWPGRQPFRQKGVSFYLEELIVPSEAVRDEEPVLVLSALEPPILPRKHSAFDRQHLRRCLLEGLAVVIDNVYVGMTKTQVNDICDTVFGSRSVHRIFARAFTVKALNLSEEVSKELRAIRQFQLELMFEDYLWMHWKPPIFLPNSPVCPPEDALSPWPDERPKTEIVPGSVLREIERIILDARAAIDQQPPSANTRASNRKQEQSRQEPKGPDDEDSGFGTSTSPDLGLARQAQADPEIAKPVDANHDNKSGTPICPLEHILSGASASLVNSGSGPANVKATPLRAKTEANNSESEGDNFQRELESLDRDVDRLNRTSPTATSIVKSEGDILRRLSTTSVPADMALLTSKASRETAGSAGFGHNFDGDFLHGRVLIAVDVPCWRADDEEMVEDHVSV